MTPLAIFAMQAAVSTALIALSIGMLASGKGDTNVYLPIIASVTATWFPNPSYPISKPPPPGQGDVEMGLTASKE